MQLSMITAVLAAVATLASGSPVSASDYAETNNGTLKWVGPNSKGDNITLYGMAHEVLAQLKSIDPDWIPRVKPADLSTDLAARQGITGPIGQYPVKCCPVAGESFTPQDRGLIEHLINSLYGLSGTFAFDVFGPRVCSTIATANNAAIVLCNDDPQNPVDVSLINLGRIADSMLANCPTACGQIFTLYDFNVIIDKYTGLGQGTPSHS